MGVLEDKVEATSILEIIYWTY